MNKKLNYLRVNMYFILKKKHFVLMRIRHAKMDPDPANVIFFLLILCHQSKVTLFFYCFLEFASPFKGIRILKWELTSWKVTL